MSFTFRCEHCHRDITAPDGAGGKRGKCPFCQKSTYIPAPVGDDDVLPLAPIDEEEERRQKAEAHAAMERDLALLDANDDGSTAPPLEQRTDLAPGELRHFVINYCLDMASSNLERAPTHVARLKQFGSVGLQAVDEILADEMLDPALTAMPEQLAQSFLRQLREELKK